MAKINYTQQETIFLIDNHKKFSTQELADKLGRKKNAIFMKLKSMGLKAKKPDVFFQEDEIEFLKQNSEKYLLKELVEKFNLTNENGLKDLLKRLNLKTKPYSRYFTQNEIDFIKENYIKLTWKQIAKELNRPVNGIRSVINRFDLQCGLEVRGKRVAKSNIKGRVITERTRKRLSWAIKKCGSRKVNTMWSKNLDDGFVAYTLAMNDPVLRQEIKQHHPELIELRRQQLILMREIKKHRKKRKKRSKKQNHEQHI